VTNHTKSSNGDGCANDFFEMWGMWGGRTGQKLGCRAVDVKGIIIILLLRSSIGLTETLIFC
jgi:hypothetical protein